MKKKVPEKIHENLISRKKFQKKNSIFYVKLHNDNNLVNIKVMISNCLLFDASKILLLLTNFTSVFLVEKICLQRCRFSRLVFTYMHKYYPLPPLAETRYCVV